MVGRLSKNILKILKDTISISSASDDEAITRIGPSSFHDQIPDNDTSLLNPDHICLLEDISEGS